MKKLMFAIGLGLISGSLWASCMGPFCWDDRGAYVAGVVQDGNGSGLPSKTASQISTTAPTAAGQEIYCSNCVNGLVCISTGTGTAAYVQIRSTTTICN